MLKTLEEIAIKKIHIIINPAAGKREPILPVLNEVFQAKEIEWDVSITKSGGDATQFAKELAKKKIDLVAVYGGDGTVMEVVSGLIGSKIPVAILPGGTANVMATELEIPKNLKAACELVTSNDFTFKTIDVAKYDDQYFMLRTSLGFEAEMMKAAPREVKNKYGLLAYFFSAKEAWKRLQTATYDVTVDNQKFRVKGFTCIVANCGNVGLADLSLHRNINVDDGLLDVVVVKRADFNLFKHILTTLIRREAPRNREVVSHWQGKNIKVSSKPRQVIQCDGEVLPKGPIEAKIIPQAIDFLVPTKADS